MIHDTGNPFYQKHALILTKQPTEYVSLFQLNNLEEIKYSLRAGDHYRLEDKRYLNLVKNSQKDFEEDPPDSGLKAMEKHIVPLLKVHSHQQ